MELPRQKDQQRSQRPLGMCSTRTVPGEDSVDKLISFFSAKDPTSPLVPTPYRASTVLAIWTGE